MPLEAGFRSDFVKTLNIARADGKYFANNMLELVLDRYKVDFGYMNFCNGRERRVDGRAGCELAIDTLLQLNNDKGGMQPV